MRQAVREIDVTEMPEVLRLVEQVRAAGEPVRLVREGEAVGVLRPPAPRRAAGRRKLPGERVRPETAGQTDAEDAFGPDDPLWDIVGIASSDGPSDVSENKYKYLAEAYADLHES